MTGRERLLRQMVDLVASGVSRGRPVPEAGRLLWRWFTDLSGTRTYHQAGPNPITYGEIKAYAALTGQPLRAEDVAAIRRLDDAWIIATYRASPAQPEAPLSRAQPIAPQSFDAVWG